VTRADSERKRRFDSLFREHVAGIASYCGWRSRTAGDGEDAVAEVFLIAWRRLDDVPDGSEARPWLYGVARRVLANQARADARRVRLNAELGAQSVPVPVPVPVAEEEDPRVVLVHEALAALAPRDREVLLLAEWEGLTPAEIARVMQIPRVTARGRLHRADAGFGPCSRRLLLARVVRSAVRSPPWS
jgi:RNA polymerase sigma-70 factor (ECF subfamily)